MLNLKVIGAGAAGNKAAIQLIKAGFNPEDVILINSTSKDIAEEFKDSAIIFGKNSEYLGGCGKERDIGKRLVLNDMKMGQINVDSIADPDTNAIIIVSSTEGGSGSAVTPILAKYITDVLSIPVIICLFFGFNTDVRGMQNSIEICQELEENYGVIGISNSKFIEAANRNQRKAETLANDEFVRIVKVLTGSSIRPSDQNIDTTDLFKLVTTPGYMRIETANIDKVKNIEQFNKAVSSVIDESYQMDCSEYGAKRIGIIFDINKSISDFVDYSGIAIQTVYGIPYEMYTHVQYTENPSSVTWIASGMKLPLREVQEIYENYLKASTSVNKSKDDFFESLAEMKGNQEDGQFNMLTQKKNNAKAKSSFFSSFGMADENVTAGTTPGRKIQVTTVSSNPKREY